jgi:hypothetical protein
MVARRLFAVAHKNLLLPIAFSTQRHSEKFASSEPPFRSLRISSLLFPFRIVLDPKNALDAFMPAF